jgi:hypothetical protein
MFTRSGGDEGVRSALQAGDSEGAYQMGANPEADLYCPGYFR